MSVNAQVLILQEAYSRLGGDSSGLVLGNSHIER